MPLRFIAKRIEKFFIYRVLHVDDTPHRIALGVAVGIFVTWTPTIGFQMILTVLLSWLLGANKLVGVPFVWISNPVTLPPIYGPNCYVGSLILGGRFSWGQIWEAFASASHFQGGLAGRVQAFWEATWKLFAPLWLGSIVVGAVLGVLTYFAIYRAVVLYRRRRRLRHGQAGAEQCAPK